VDGSPAVNTMALQHGFGDDLSHDGIIKDHRRSMSGPSGVIRRARSATVMELGPYPHKSHSCPIPTCGRLFKRLEHLKR
jgi:transcription factor STE12